MNQPTHLKLLLASLFLLSPALLVPTPVFALSSDNQQPIQIQSNSAEIDEQKGITIYKGDVEVIQGTIKLLADRVTVFSEGDKVNRVLAIGQPAHYQQIPKPGDQTIHAYGNSIEYLVTKEKLKVKTNARVEQKDTFSTTGKVIDYDMKKGVAHASSGSTTSRVKDKSRVQTVLQPKKASVDDTADKASLSDKDANE